MRKNIIRALNWAYSTTMTVIIGVGVGVLLALILGVVVRGVLVMLGLP